MRLSRRQFTREFKLTAVRHLEQGVSIGELARALEVNPNVLHRWRREFRQGPGNAFPGWGKALVGGPHSGTGAEDWPAGAGDRFFEGVLATHRRTADAAGIDWKAAICEKVAEDMKVRRGLTIRRMIELSRISRASFYRYEPDVRPESDPDLDLRDAIQRIALEMPSYGRPIRTSAALSYSWFCSPRFFRPSYRPSSLINFAILSARAPIVFEGLTPMASGMMEPSAT